VDGTESISDACGGTDGTESISDACGGTDGTESISDACGGTDGTESISDACGGTDGTESVNAKAELATAQPATKAIKLIFMTISPINLLRKYDGAACRMRHPLEVRATPGRKFPHVGATLYA
jgi:hypothetical protein